MVQSLNITLLTAPELHTLRLLLHGTSAGDAHATSLYEALFRSWSHDPVSTLSLALMARVYVHAARVVAIVYVRSLRLPSSPLFPSPDIMRSAHSAHPCCFNALLCVSPPCRPAARKSK